MWEFKDALLISLNQTWIFTSVAVIAVFSRTVIGDIYKGVFGLRLVLSSSIMLAWIGAGVSAYYLDPYFKLWLLEGLSYTKDYVIIFGSGYLTVLAGCLHVLVGTYKNYRYKVALIWWILCTGHIVCYANFYSTG